MKKYLPIFMAIGLISGILFAKENWRNYLDVDRPIYTGSFSDRHAQKSSQYKIVTYNIKFSRQLKKIAHLLATKPELNDADVIFLQEVAGMPQNPEKNGAHYLAQELHYNYVYAPAFLHPFNDLDFGVAILSKFPIKKFQKILLPHHDFRSGTQRIALYAQLEDHGQLLDVVSAHLETLQLTKQRLDQAHATILPVINSSHPVFVAGDFNSAPFWQRWALIKFMQKEKLQYFSKSYGGTGPVKMKLDLAFGKNIKTLQSGIVKIPSSDHNPVWFKTSLP